MKCLRFLKVWKELTLDKFFIRAEGCTRGHGLKLVKPRCRLDCRRFSFSHRSINLWNGLPEEVIACNTVNGFKKAEASVRVPAL